MNKLVAVVGMCGSGKSIAKTSKVIIIYFAFIPELNIIKAVAIKKAIAVP